MKILAGYTASDAVVAAVAEEEGVGPTHLPPMHEAIDPEALDCLLCDGGRRVEFEYLGYLVSIDDALSVTLSDSAVA